MLVVKTLSTVSELEALGPEWDAMAAGWASPLVQHAWFLSAARTYADGAELAVFTARRNGRLCAVAPMVVDRTGLVARLRLLGFESPEPERFPHDDEEALEAVCAAVVAHKLPVVLPRADAASPEWRALNAASRRRGLAIARGGNNSYYMTVLQEDWDSFEASMASKRRSDVRRLRRQLEQHGTVGFDVVCPDAGSVDAAVAELIRVEASGWKGRSGTAIANRPNLVRFIHEYARQAARLGILRVSTLSLNGDAIAVQMDIEHGGRLWGLKMGADERWSKYAPGVLSTHELIRWSIERGLTGCEHLGKAEDWQRRWPYETRELSAFNFYSPTLGGAYALAADVSRFGARKLTTRVEAELASWKARLGDFKLPRAPSAAPALRQLSLTAPLALQGSAF